MWKINWCFSFLGIFLGSAHTFEYKIGDRGVKLMSNVESWIGALQVCHHIGMELPMITSAEEDRQLQKIMRKNSIVQIWLGATDIDTEGDWVWIESGKTLQYANWAQNPTEPNNQNGDEDCLLFELGRDDTTFNDINCEKFLNRVICMESMVKKDVAEIIANVYEMRNKTH